MKKIVVTGALGFIGFSLCLRLLDKGFKVVGIDGMINSQLKGFYEEKLLWVGRNSQFHFINKRIEDTDIKAVLRGVDTVYHMAASTSKERSWDELPKTIEDNVGVTEKIISACEQNTKVIYTSSTQVYGERTGTITENTPLNPITPYSLTKMAAEALIKSKCKQFGVPYVIFRLPTVYGPWQRDDMSYCKLIVKELMSDKNTSATSDRVTEDVLYIEDILDTLIEAGIKDECKNEVFNLSTGKVNEWFRGLALISNKTISEPSDKRLLVSISNEKVVSQLGFKVVTNLETGLKAQKNHIKKYKHLYLRQ
ncbi:hypothetical protein BKP37_18135 [Anaerobacillus alkalilacustris]|uniref:NAD-dependent epimerase/dehydratase domain-containing protein n=1 Tax=Anaerobacillus alkalilacustris TaxID=393763 RepID=A0A1S2LFI1_9BACI|nr:NAD(P)-dependent oxidoreductase [Anaerobacillus alkalilacustris]OIJ10457.1 hypothetical protein BKP37_18135 [Anaerobacillus alkalilacustris]